MFLTQSRGSLRLAAGGLPCLASPETCGRRHQAAPCPRGRSGRPSPPDHSWGPLLPISLCPAGPAQRPVPTLALGVEGQPPARSLQWGLRESHWWAGRELCPALPFRRGSVGSNLEPILLIRESCWRGRQSAEPQQCSHAGRQPCLPSPGAPMLQGGRQSPAGVHPTPPVCSTSHAEPGA